MTVLLTLLISVAAGAMLRDQQTDTASLVGRLATVEPAARRLTLLPEGTADLVEVFLTEDAAVVQDETELSLSELVIHTGRRIQVEYQLESGRRIGLRVTVEPE